jgi:hypothetical protein
VEVDDDGLLPTTVYMVYILVVAEISHAVDPNICIGAYPRSGVRRYSEYFMLMD